MTDPRRRDAGGPAGPAMSGLTQASERLLRDFDKTPDAIDVSELSARLWLIEQEAARPSGEVELDETPLFDLIREYRRETNPGRVLALWAAIGADIDTRHRMWLNENARANEAARPSGDAYVLDEDVAVFGPDGLRDGLNKGTTVYLAARPSGVDANLEGYWEKRYWEVVPKLQAALAEALDGRPEDRT